MEKINFEQHKSPRFELVIQVRDNLGRLTGKTKSFATDDEEELDKFWQRNNGVNKTKKKEKDNKEKSSK